MTTVPVPVQSLCAEAGRTIWIIVYVNRYILSLQEQAASSARGATRSYEGYLAKTQTCPAWNRGRAEDRNQPVEPLTSEPSSGPPRAGRTRCPSPTWTDSTSVCWNAATRRWILAVRPPRVRGCRGRCAEGAGLRQGTRSAPRARRTLRRRWRAASAASRCWIFTVSPPRVRVAAVGALRARVCVRQPDRRRTRDTNQAAAERERAEQSPSGSTLAAHRRGES